MSYNILRMPKMYGEIRCSAYNVRTKETTEYPVCHNLITNGMASILSYADTYKNSVSMSFGSGSAEPSQADTSLTTPLWSINAATINSNVDFAQRQMIRTFQSIIPAASAYVGTITEIGLYFGSTLITHSLLRDAEDRAISIEKTDLIELTVQYNLVFLSDATYPNIMLTAAAIAPGIPSLQWRYYAWPSARNASTALSELLCGDERGCTIQGKNLTFRPVLYNTSDEGTVAFDSELRTSTLTNVRLTADQGNTNFLKGVCLRGGNKLYYKIIFPNEELFPIQTFEGMDVGVGDGSTQDFLPPLAFWLENTEEIFLNGAKLTRDVDYTCDYYNNIDNQIGLYPSFMATPVDGMPLFKDPLTKDTYSNTVQSPNAAINASGEVKQGWYTNYLVGLYPDTPLVLQFHQDEDPALDWSVDTWQLQWVYSGSAWSHNTIRPIIKVEYSDDNNVWQLFGQTSSYVTNSLTSIVADQPVNARYWRFSIHQYSSFPAIDSVNEDNYGYLVVIGRRTGAKIHFNNPPAKDALITMNASIDRPLKNDKHVIDWNPVIQF